MTIVMTNTRSDGDHSDDFNVVITIHVVMVAL